MASDGLLKVIAGLVKREGRIAKEDAKKAKEALKAEAENDEEEDEDEDPVGDTATKPEPEPEDDEEDDEEGDGEGDTKPNGPDPVLVAQVAAIVKKEIEDEEKEKKKTEVKLSGTKEKIDTKPKMEQRGRMNFKEAVRMAVTSAHLIEGYEESVLKVLEDESIKGPLGYEPFFEKGKLFIMKGQEKNAEKALKNSREIKKLPKIVGEEMGAEEYLAMESVDVDGRCSGFKEALRRLTYEKIKQMKEKEEAKKEEVEVDETSLGSMLDKKAKKLGKKKKKVGEDAASFMAAASAAKRDGKKKFKFGDPEKEYPVTIKVDIPQKEEVEVDESNELQAIMALDDVGIEAEINKEGDLVVKKKDLKKAEAQLKKSFRKGGQPKLVGEGADKDTKGDKEAYQKFFQATLKKFGVTEPDQLEGDKKKEFFDAIDKGWKADNEKPEPGDKKEEVEIDEKKIKSKKIKGGKVIKKVTSDKKSTKMVGGREVRMKPAEAKKRKIGAKKAFKKKKGQMAAIQRKTARSMKKRSSMGMSYKPDGSMIERWKNAAFDKVRAIRSKLNEGIDAVAARELKLYIEQDRDLYRQQIVPIIKNVQRKMKSGKYDHAQAPKLWLYLVDNGAKKYVKEFGGDVKRDFPKDLRLSVANEFANEYKAEIEIQGGEMI